MPNGIEVLPKDYKPKDDEVFTKDEQLVAFASWHFQISPIGFLFQDGHQSPWWVVRETPRWKLAVREWRGVADIYSRHSREVGRLKSMVRTNREPS